jgi:hypothetical protein
VHLPWEDQPTELTAELTLRYGERVHTQTEPTADFTFDLGFVPDEEGFIQVLWRDPDGTAVEGWATTIPAGPFAAG